MYINENGKKVVEFGDLGTRNYYAKEFNKEKEKKLNVFFVTQLDKVVKEYDDKDTIKRSVISLVNYYLDTRREIVDEEKKLNPLKSEFTSKTISVRQRTLD